MVNAMKKDIILSIVFMAIYTIVWLGMVWYAYHFDYSPGWYRILGRSVAWVFLVALFSFIWNLWLQNRSCSRG